MANDLQNLALMKTPFAFLVCFATFAVAACHHDRAVNNPDPGPMQKAGAAVDHAAHNVKDAAKDTGHDVKQDLSK